MKIIKRKLLIILMLFLLLGTVIGMFFHKSKDTIKYVLLIIQDLTIMVKIIFIRALLIISIYINQMKMERKKNVWRSRCQEKFI